MSQLLKMGDLANVYVCMCARHWPPNFRTKRKKGYNIPIDPPSIFHSPTSTCPQTTPSGTRNIKRRIIDSELRAECSKTKNEEEEEEAKKDIISDMKALAEYWQFLQLIVVETEHGIDILTIEVHPL